MIDFAICGANILLGLALIILFLSNDEQKRRIKMIKKYRLKSDEVKAIQFTGNNIDEIEKFTGGRVGRARQPYAPYKIDEPYLEFWVGCYIVKHKNGDLGALTQRTFNEIYEETK